MLRMSVSTEEYLMLGDDIKIVFLGGSHNHMRIMIDAPKDVNIVRSTVLEKNNPEMKKSSGGGYYAEPELPEKYRKEGRWSTAGSIPDSDRLGRTPDR